MRNIADKINQKEKVFQMRQRKKEGNGQAAVVNSKKPVMHELSKESLLKPQGFQPFSKPSQS